MKKMKFDRINLKTGIIFRTIPDEGIKDILLGRKSGEKKDMEIKVLGIKRQLNIWLLVMIGILGIWLLPHQLIADEISVTSSVSANKVGIEDSFILTIDVESSAAYQLDVDVSLKGFSANYRGPSVSNRSSTSIINGKMSSSYTKSYNYTVYPTKEGSLNIPQLTVTVNGKDYKTQSHKVEIVAGSLRKRNNTSNRRNSFFDPFMDPLWDDNFYNNRRENELFIEVEVDKDSIYVGQHVIVKYTYFKLDNVWDNISDMETFDGYGIESSTQGDGTWKKVRRNGIYYNKQEIVTMNIIAQKAGTLTLPIFTVSNNRIIQNRVYKSPTKTILVKELPERGKGIDFSNAIGKFTIDSELAQRIMYENQQNQLQVTIKGKGNLSKVLYPEAPQIEGLEILKPKATLDLQDDGNGTLVLTYDIIPSVSGKFKIPPISFNYFDDTLHEYQTIFTPSELLTVKSISSPVEDAKYNDHNIFYTRNKPYLGNITKEYLFTNKLIYWFILTTFLIVMLSYLVFYKIQMKRMSNVGYVRRRDALRILKQAITESEELVEKNDVSFYTNAQNNILKFIAKLTKASLQLSQQQLIEEFQKIYPNKVTVAKINSFLTYCEQIKYQPNFKTNENLQNDFEKFKSIYDEIRNSKR